MNFKISMLIISMILIGCENPKETTAASKAPTTTPSDSQPSLTAPIIAPAVASPTVDQSVSITVKSLSMTVAPVNGWPLKTYTATGHCTQYNSKTYCWDDGIHTLDWTSNHFHYGPFTYDFWSLMESNSHPLHCDGVCANDLLDAPTNIDVSISPNLPTGLLTNVMTNGSSTQLDCLLADNHLNCGTVQIDVVQ